MVENVPQSGYLSQNDPRPHFGLGAHAEVDLLTIRWPSGTVQTIEHVKADQIFTVTEPGDRAPRRRGAENPNGLPNTNPLATVYWWVVSPFQASSWRRFMHRRYGKKSCGLPSSAADGYLTPMEARFSANGLRLYVVCEDADSLLSVDLRKQKVVSRVKVGHKPKGSRFRRMAKKFTFQTNGVIPSPRLTQPPSKCGERCRLVGVQSV